MTLTKQLLLSGLIVLLCLFTGMLSFVVKNTQTFLDQQLSSHSQDTATALGLSLTLMMKNNDVVTASRVVDAVFDRGYYQSIKIINANGSPIVERHLDVKVAGVPQYFIDLLKLKTQTKEAIIMDGWRKVGKVIIESNPGFAYKQIWLTFIESLKWLIMTGVIAIILGGGILFIILRPLRAITKQAAAIRNQQFTTQDSLPWTIDLRQVVIAMNNMSSRLKKVFEDQAQATALLQEQAYKDPVTHLGNRRYFDMQMGNLLKDEEKGAAGALLLIELKDFKEYNDKFGYEAGDALLKSTANVITQAVKTHENAILANKGASFFVVTPGQSKSNAIEVATKICHEFTNSQTVGNIGLTDFTNKNSQKEIISRADMALRAAQREGDNGWQFFEGEEQKIVHGVQEWAAIFEKTIKENSIILHYQPIEDLHDPNQKMFEVLLRIELEDKQVISAGVFMPMAERLNQIMALDKLVIENVIDRIQKSDQYYLFSVNIGPSSLDDNNFKTWLLERVKTLGKKAKQLIIELPEFGVINRIDLVRDFYLKFSAIGGKTAIDHYGKNFNTFSYLYNLKLDYLKIDGGFIRQIEESEENQFFVKSLVEIAHRLEIQVIAEAVETEKEYEMLKQLKVDGIQGYFVGKPTPFTERSF